MTTPREIRPGHCYLVTRRCTQREFLLRPDDATNNAFTYCLIAAAQRAEVDVLLSCVMSNHHHTVVFDRHDPPRLHRAPAQARRQEPELPPRALGELLGGRGALRARLPRAREPAGFDAVFPAGSYWLKRFAPVPIATA
jgi:hypothetical protein